MYPLLKSQRLYICPFVSAKWIFKQTCRICGQACRLKKSADVLLILDTGEKLPVHSSFLAVHPDVSCQIFSSEPPSEGSIWLPFPDSSRESACALLQYIYALTGEERLSTEHAQAIIPLAYNFKMTKALHEIDSRLCAKVFSTSGPGFVLVSHLCKLLVARTTSIQSKNAALWALWPFASSFHRTLCIPRKGHGHVQYSTAHVCVTDVCVGNSVSVPSRV